MNMSCKLSFVGCWVLIWLKFFKFLLMGRGKIMWRLLWDLVYLFFSESCFERVRTCCKISFNCLKVYCLGLLLEEGLYSLYNTQTVVLAAFAAGTQMSELVEESSDYLSWHSYWHFYQLFVLISTQWECRCCSAGRQCWVFKKKDEWTCVCTWSVFLQINVFIEMERRENDLLWAELLL